MGKYFGKITLEDPAIRKVLVRESRTPRSILVHALCDIEDCIASFRNGMRISTEGKSWTRMEYGIFVSKLALYQYFPNIWVYRLRILLFHSPPNALNFFDTPGTLKIIVRIKKIVSFLFCFILLVGQIASSKMLPCC